ncbi:MAG: sugar phosphate isomerase/epimerase [Planctomycetota bacterium]
MSTQLAAQMYTLREHCQDAAGIAESCRKVKAMGYDAIQASAAFFAEIEGSAFRTILDDTGLVCCATHRSWEQLQDVQAEIDFHAAIGCKYAAIGGWGWSGDETEDDWKKFAADFQALADPYAAAGLRIGYHNHSHEWAPFGLAAAPEQIDPKRTPMELLVRELGDPTFFEIDTYWVAHAGGDVAHWLNRLAGRIGAIHLKDMTINAKREHKMCEVGAGNLNWPAVLDAARAAGVEWYIVERDAGDLDPFESLRISLENCKAMGLR